MIIGMALSLGSLWALLPAAVGTFAMLLRTNWEDEMLQSELPGYKEYTKRIRYRLVPGNW